MANKPNDDRPRRKPSRRGGSPDSRPRRGGGNKGGGGRGPQGQQQRGRLSREEVEWARDLWEHKEPPEEIADQLGVELPEIEKLIAGWQQ